MVMKIVRPDHTCSAMNRYCRKIVNNCTQYSNCVGVCGRLHEVTYTVDDVNEMLDGLLAVVLGEVDSELTHLGHTNVLLLMQMFQQAEKWHLKLQADISELENR